MLFVSDCIVSYRSVIESVRLLSPLALLILDELMLLLRGVGHSSTAEELAPTRARLPRGRHVRVNAAKAPLRVARGPRLSRHGRRRGARRLVRNRQWRWLLAGACRAAGAEMLATPTEATAASTVTAAAATAEAASGVTSVASECARQLVKCGISVASLLVEATVVGTCLLIEAAVRERSILVDCWSLARCKPLGTEPAGVGCADLTRILADHVIACGAVFSPAVLGERAACGVARPGVFTHAAREETLPALLLDWDRDVLDPNAIHDGTLLAARDACTVHLVAASRHLLPVGAMFRAHKLPTLGRLRRLHCVERLQVGVRWRHRVGERCIGAAQGQVAQIVHDIVRRR